MAGSKSQVAIGLEADGVVSGGSVEAVLRLLGVRTCEGDLGGAILRGGRRWDSRDGMRRGLSAYSISKVGYEMAEVEARRVREGSSATRPCDKILDETGSKIIQLIEPITWQFHMSSSKNY